MVVMDVVDEALLRIELAGLVCRLSFWSAGCAAPGTVVGSPVRPGVVVGHSISGESGERGVAGCHAAAI